MKIWLKEKTFYVFRCANFVIPKIAIKKLNVWTTKKKQWTHEKNNPLEEAAKLLLIGFRKLTSRFFTHD